MSPPPLDLLIIGGGPIGLATAVGAIHRGAKRVLVVEQAQDLLPVGSPLDLLPNAVKAITALAPGIRDRLQPFMRTPDPSKPRLRVVSASGTDLDASYIPSLASLYWWQLQRLLLDALPDERMLVLNHQLVDIQHEDDTGLVCAVFVADRQRKNKYKNWDEKESHSQPRVHEDGNYQCRPEFERVGVGHSGDNDCADYGPNAVRVKCRAKVIVGADGINSVARRCVYRDSGKDWDKYAHPLYSGVTRFGIFGDPYLSPDDEQRFQQLYKRHSGIVKLTVEPDLISHDSLRVLVFQIGKNKELPFSCFLSVFASASREEALNASQEDLQRLVTSRIREGGFSETLVKLFRSLWESGGRIKALPFYTVPADHPLPFKTMNHGEALDYPPDFERPWYHRRVVLAGDAVHAMPSFLAQGSAMGLEDAFELVTHMGCSGIWSMAADEAPSEEQLEGIFKRYRAGRLTRVCKIQNQVMNRRSEHEVKLVRRETAEAYGYEPEVVADSIGVGTPLS
eukprot:GFKZ01000263.1.p1 GENE.GFKZ01000263.1~~GFKZ01000263.1.p1  ORF type:complete len:509 (-),score=55.99 GFKZ01000263.1:736-2262(-)